MSQLQHWTAPLTTLASFWIAAAFLRLFLNRHLETSFRKASISVDGNVIKTIKTHLPLWVILAGVSAAVHVSPLADNRQILLHRVVLVGFFISATWAVAVITAHLTELFLAKSNASPTGSNLVVNIVKFSVLTMGSLLLLSNLGISITPLLTALGVSSLAVALALQDTLTNVFAGIHIVMGQLAEAGDFIELDSGAKGIVVGVGWRTTRLRDAADNPIIVPNVKIAQAVVTNYRKPAEEQSVLISMNVDYGSDLKKAQRICRDVAKQVQQTAAGGVASFEPRVQFSGFDPNGIGVSVTLKAQSLSGKGIMIHEFITRVHEQFKKAGVRFPRT